MDKVEYIQKTIELINEGNAFGKLVKAMGFDMTPGAVVNYPDFVGKKVKILIEQNEYEGKTYANVSKILKL